MPPQEFFFLFKEFFNSGILFFFKILFIYLTERDHEQVERRAEREEEAGSRLSREPDVGLECTASARGRSFHRPNQPGALRFFFVLF